MTTTTNGAAATGEAHSMEALKAEIRKLAADGQASAAILSRIAEAAERLRSDAASRGLDPATVASLDRIKNAAIEAAQHALKIPTEAQQALATLQAQQGGVQEALAAQPKTAEPDWYRR